MSGRLVVVGDVHGCADELHELLGVLALDASDELVFVGDLVVRGPDPAGVLAIVRERGGRAVRGNHEFRLLRWRALRRDRGASEDLSDVDRRVMKSKALLRTAGAIDEAGWALLESLPLWLELPELTVVHAGIVPGVALEAQRERDLLYLRGIDEDGEPTELRDVGTPWGALYEGPPHIVFGHYARAEPQLHPWATGLDTGCVYGGALTALVVERGEPVPPPQARQLVSVSAHRAHHPIAR